MDKYSVLMAVYHKEQPAYLRMAVKSMLSQTVEPDEFVLVCDGPLTEALDAVIAEFCGSYPQLFRVVRLKTNLGLGAALNAGLRHCSHELVARLDSDDLALPDRMQLQLKSMTRETSALGGQIAEFSDTPDEITAFRLVPTEETAIRAFLRYRNPMNHTTVLLRKSHVLRVGGYEEVPGFEDYMLWAKLLSGGGMLSNIPHVCCNVRADAGMFSRRGGVQYFQRTLKMERLLLDKALVSPAQYCRNIAVRFGGTVLLNAPVRRIVFLMFLRSKVPETKTPSGRHPLTADSGGMPIQWKVLVKR